MRLIKILFALFIFGLVSSFEKLLKFRTKAAYDGADEVPSDVAFASALLTLGKYFIIIAFILVILFI